jgi:threonyl-tRNA synthetase
MAYAVKILFPEVKIAIGPSIEDGFYYDFEYKEGFSSNDLNRIEEKMKEIIVKDIPFIREEITKDEALKLFKDEKYKLELIEDIREDILSIYRLGDFVDLCLGPHLPSSGIIKAFKLLSIAGAYWRGDERNPMLQRIYGTSFPTKEELDRYLERIEEAKKRDHRKLGKELDLFSINDDIGSGLILWHPKGALVRNIIESFWREEHYKNGYQLLYTPHIAKAKLWQTSGHFEFYRENMYSPMNIDKVDYIIKPMNCPFHIAIYKSQIRSYRDFPIRWAELGTVYRYERSGVLHGLLRVRGFTQDDAHIFLRPDQLDEEIIRVINFTLYILKSFGFEDYEVYLSTRPEKFVGSLENWDRATKSLKKGLEESGLSYSIDPGEGVFYGPKIDIKIKDSLQRLWQCSTIQVDFNIPERFDIGYVGKDGYIHRPIMVHRALMGSLERFFGCLIEHYAGRFPLWLAPVQVIVIPVSEKSYDYGKKVLNILIDSGIRAEIDMKDEKLGYKIREAQLKKIPYMAIVGENEKKKELISPRKGDGSKVLDLMKTEDFIAMLKDEIVKKI